MHRTVIVARAALAPRILQHVLVEQHAERVPILPPLEREQVRPPDHPQPAAARVGELHYSVSDRALRIQCADRLSARRRLARRREDPYAQHRARDGAQRDASDSLRDERDRDRGRHRDVG